MSDRSAALARLDALGVAYELTEHPAVFTIEDMEQLGLTGSGTVCKNLFLRDAKGRRHFLVVIPGIAAPILNQLKRSSARQD